MGPHFMVTGLPASGKTTLVQRVVEEVGKVHVLRSIAAGFTTEEVLGPQGREGFDVVALDGRRALLSRNEASAQYRHLLKQPRPRVGRYLVHVPSFESIALPELVIRPEVKLFVVDEIGKMEFYSESFIEAVGQVLNADCVVLGVVPYSREVQTFRGKDSPQARGRTFVNEICERPDVRLVTVTRSNRERLVRPLTQDILQALEQKLKTDP